MLDERDGEAVVVELGHRQRHAVDGDRALLDQVTENVRRDVEPDALAVGFVVDGANGSDRVDMPLDVVPAERLSGPQGRLEIHLGAERLRPPFRLDHDVERQPAVVVARDGEAHAVDGDGVADAGADVALDHEPAVLERRHAPALLDYPCEHRVEGY